jgi:arylsulfatase A-like enzyme
MLVPFSNLPIFFLPRIEMFGYSLRKIEFGFLALEILIGILLFQNCEVFADDRPNILVIVADDLGYADVGFQGSKDIPTPHLNELAKSGVRCTNGYVSHAFCSPTRAGLLSGRYQHRFGHENNPAWLPESTVAGLPISETTLADVMRSAGYATAAIGKWHLGAHPQFHPNRRGFDHYFGALGGGHVYLEGLPGGPEYTIPMNRNGTPEPLSGYITTVFGNEASKFMQEKPPKPWFMYLAFNAPHTPLQSTDALKERVSHIENKERRDLAAVIVGLDDAIGEVVSTLKSTNQFENTLVFFFSDNGGPITVSKCDNSPLRAGKGSLYEGGVRVPFIVSWPKKLPAGGDYNHPVISLDVFSTAVAVSNAQVPSSKHLEGSNLIPHLSGDSKLPPHERLFWRTGGGANWSVREGNLKLVSIEKAKPGLYDLSNDVSEMNDLADAKPETVQRLEMAFREWDKQNISPIFESPKSGTAKKKKQ